MVFRLGMEGYQKVNGQKLPDEVMGTLTDMNSKYLSYNYIFEPSGEKLGTASPDDISRYNLYVVENFNNETRGENFTFRMNSAKNYFIKDNASTFSFGVKGKFMKK